MNSSFDFNRTDLGPQSDVKLACTPDVRAEYERELFVERVNAGINAARQNGTRFGRPLSDPVVLVDKLQLSAEARAKGRAIKDAAQLGGWSRATLAVTSKPKQPLRARSRPTA